MNNTSIISVIKDFPNDYEEKLESLGVTSIEIEDALSILKEREVKKHTKALKKAIAKLSQFIDSDEIDNLVFDITHEI